MHQSEQNKNLPTLIKDRKSSVLKSRGKSRFFGIADDREGNVLALKFISESGEQKAIHYHDIVSPMDFNGNNKIVLNTPRVTITIRGKHLEDLFDYILQHKVKWIEEPQSSFPDVEEGMLEINSLRFEME